MAIFGRAFPIRPWVSKAPIAAAGGNKTIAVDAGSYAVTGQSVTLTHAWIVGVDAGAYAVTGQDVVLTHAWVVSVDGGSYAIAGQDVALTHGYAVSVDAGSYSVTGQDVTLTHAWIVSVDAGSYGVSGQDVTLTHGWVIPIDAGSYAVTGQDVALTKTGAFSILVEAGSYAVTGQDVALAHQWVMDAGSGSYLVSGQDITLELSAAPPVVPDEEPQVFGGTTAGFRRRDWRDLLDGLRREIEDTRNAARKKKKKEADKLRQAATIAAEALEELKDAANRVELDYEAERLRLALEAANGAKRLESVFAEANEAIRIARAIMEQIEEEEDMTVLLMAL